ncbi:MAG: hypothetical protein SX243_15540 [Acidobacteriota bacterium]|nr:hypothetical protein [Acidobacteriota bacterium]
MAVPGVVQAQQSSWQSLGPESGEVLTLLPDPVLEDVVYAGTVGGNVFVSEDAGTSWQLLASGLLTDRVNDLAKGNTANASLFAATDHGVYRLAAGADQWVSVSDDLPGTEVFSLVVHPAAPGTVYASMLPGSGSSLYQIYRSSNSGLDWTLVSGGRQFSGPLAISPSTPTVLYAGGYDGIYRSLDDGDFWLRTSNGLPFSTFITDLAVDPDASGTVYATTWAISSPTVPVFKSVNLGDTWTPVSLGLEDAGVSFGRLAIDPQDSSTLYVGGNFGVFRSTNSGGTWQAANSAPANRAVLSISVDPRTGDVYAGAVAQREPDSPGVLRSTDQGASWQGSAEGLNASFISSLAPDPTAAGRWLVSLEAGGPLRTENGGGTWSPSDNGLDRPLTGPIVRAGQDPQTLYVLAGDRRSGLNQIYRSIDGGASWEARGEEGECCRSALTVDPQDSSVVYWFENDALQRSLDGGLTSTQVGLAPYGPSVLKFHPSQPDTLLIGVSRDSGLPVSPPIIFSELYRSVDGGVTWDLVLEPGFDSSAGGWAIHFDPHNPSRVLAGYTSFLSGRLLRSLDGGSTWEDLDPPEDAGIQTLLADPDIPGRWYAGTNDQGVFRSVDGGSTWSPWNQGLAAADVTAFALDPFDPQILWAGTSGGGAFSLVRDPALPCVSSQASLCLLGRFQVEVDWQDPRGNAGTGKTLSLSDVTGAFWFFQPDNLELAVKILDGRRINGHFWVFYGALSTVSYELVVTDTITGRVSRYENPAGRLASVGDTRAFQSVTGVSPAPLNALASLESDSLDLGQIQAGLNDALGAGALSSAPEATSHEPLVLGDGRFEIEVSWHTPQGAQGQGSGIALTEDSGGLWFFQPENLEVFVKVLDGRSINGRFWVFYGSLTNVGFDLLITDTETGVTRQYSNPAGNFGSRGDVRAF